LQIAVVEKNYLIHGRIRFCMGKEVLHAALEKAIRKESNLLDCKWTV
jgi:hypothetical protein